MPHNAGITAVVLAAGEGTRMKSKHPKVAHEVLGKPMVRWVVDAARTAGADRIVVVIGNGADEVRSLLAGYDDVECVMQEQRLGTGHAVQIALAKAGIDEGRVLVLCGDTPLLRASTLGGLIDTASTSAGGALLTMEYDDPTGYGRVICDGDGRVRCIVEQKDCSDEQKRIRTCNAGVYCFDAAALSAHINELSCENSQHEFYLTDMVAILRAHGMPMVALNHDEDPAELMGVNSRIQLADATRTIQRRINRDWMAEGVTMLDPSQVWIGPDVTIGRDTTILPGSIIYGATVIGQDCVVGPQTRLTDVLVGDGVMLDETVAVDSIIGDGVACGPRAYIRSGCHLMDGSKVGTHCEVKKTTVGRGSKVPHLSYVGDTVIGQDCNIGAGTITCNYDGKNKSATVIGDDVFVGSGALLVAPATLGDGSFVAAGTVVPHKEVPAGTLGICRMHMDVVEGWVPPARRGE